jgi:hypothetical protein
MDLTRRHVAIAGALALGVSSLARPVPAFAESPDAAALTQPHRSPSVPG